MADGYSKETLGIDSDTGPVNPAGGLDLGSAQVRFRGTLDLSKDSVKRAVNDRNLVVRLPGPIRISHIAMISSISLSSRTFSFGTKADNDRFGAVGAGPAANRKVEWFQPSEMVKTDNPGTHTDIWMTNRGGATLPSSGTVIVLVYGDQTGG